MLLSVIIPLFNGSKYISETISMILKSDYADLEIIVVNDGSTDDSASIVNEIIKKDKRVKLINKENGGVVSSRNLGAKHSNGDFICFVDQDDFVKSFMYSKIISKMQEENSDMGMCSSGRNINGDESVFCIQKNKSYEGSSIFHELICPILLNGFDLMNYDDNQQYPHIWNCVFRKAFWDEAKLYFRAYVNFEDDLLVKIEALSKAKRVSTISDIGYYWRVNLHSETYAHHFVESIGEKQNQVYLDIKNSLSNCSNVTEGEINVIKNAIFCKQYLNTIHNLTSREIRVNFRFIKKYYTENIYSRDFCESIQMRKYIKKGQIKMRILLPLLQHRMSIINYLTEILLDKILLLTLHSSVLTKFERQIKKVR